MNDPLKGTYESIHSILFADEHNVAILIDNVTHARVRFHLEMVERQRVMTQPVANIRRVERNERHGRPCTVASRRTHRMEHYEYRTTVG